MSDTRKIVNTRQTRSMTHEQEEHLIQAFERFAPERSVSIQVPKQDHLATSWKKGYCCKHHWKDITFRGDDLEVEAQRAFLQKKFDDEDLGDQQKMCIHCEAFSLWENGQLFAYDAIDLIEDEPVKESRQGRNNRKR